MTNADDPVNAITEGVAGPPTGGLTKRELFAAMALQGVMSADLQDQLTYQQCSAQAVKAADALIEELNKEKS